MRRGAAVLLHAAAAAAHGVLVRPISRATRLATNDTDGLKYAGNCPNNACVWYNQNTRLPAGQATTICDPKLRTMGVSCGSPSPPGDFSCTPGAAVPWCAPGTAPAAPCGVFGGGAAPLAGGRDMRDLPGEPMATWRAGEAAEVVWAITANHGGGYAYRLCPASSDLSEACFQRHHLPFSGDTQWFINTSGAVLAQKKAVRVSAGTFPPGSEWTQTPYPMEKGTIPAIPGMPGAYGRGPFGTSVKDMVHVPADLPSGHYVLSWRWDAEQTKQVWAHCSDVLVVNDAVPSPPPSPSKYVPSGKYVCQSGSIGLDVRECDAWVELFDALNGPQWPKDWADGCDLRTDPCGCGSSWRFFIQCSSLRDVKHITELYLLGSVVSGTIPASIGGLTQLKALSLVDTTITGSVPDVFASMPEMIAVWLDHNKQLGGAIPASFGSLKGLSAFELHMSNFTGSVPPMRFGDIPDCHIEGNRFACPLPPGADTCGASCA